MAMSGDRRRRRCPRYLRGLAAALTLALAVPAAAAPPPPPRLPGPPPLRAEARPRLVPQDDGTLRYADPDGYFVGVIHPDGRVEIRDVPRVGGTVNSPVGGLGWAVNMAEAVKRPRGERDRPETEGPGPEPSDERSRLYQATETVNWGPYGPALILISVGFRFGGIADLATRRGQRRRAAAKAQFLKNTEALRQELAERKQQERRRAAGLRLGQELASTWNDRGLSLAERKRLLFERWDECDELEAQSAAVPGGELRRGGERMRRRIEIFIRRVAPPGSTAAFTEAELRRLNARRTSQQRFTPYDSPPRRTRPNGESPAALPSR